jgi:Tfp pilus assembly protein PilE
MGSQQLLLIVLGVIIIGLMVLAGISIFSAYSESSNRDQIIASLYDLGQMAQTHYKKQEVSGGGGGTFSGWDIPQNLKNTEIGTFAANVNANRVNLSCNGKHKGLNGSTLIRVTARIDETGIRINVLN